MADQEGLARFAEPGWNLPSGGIAPDMVLLGVYDDAGAIRAAIGFNQFYRHYAHAHIATDGKAKWATRATLAAIFGYAFEFRGLTRLTGIQSVRNVRAQVMCLKLGFRIEGMSRQGYEDGTDAVIFGMLADECRWLRR